MNLKIQDFLGSLGKYGCYFLCLANAAWRETSAIYTLPVFAVNLAERSVHGGFLTEECYVLDPIKILTLGGLCKFLKVEKALKRTWEESGNRLVIAEFKKGDLTHFAEVDALDRVVFDPLMKGRSLTHPSFLASYRVFS